MKDLFNREIDYLRISLTDLCNLRCTYCMPKDGVRKLSHENILSFERIKEIVEASVKLGIKKIRLTGGEPLVRKGISEICRLIADIPGVEELCLTTNGVLLKEYAKELKDAGVTRINISLDTLNKDKYKKITRGGNLDDVLEGIKAVKEAGFKNTKINCVLIGGFNDDEIEDFAKFANSNELSFRFIELMPIGEGEKLESKAFISNDEILRRLPDLVKVEDDGVSSLYKFKCGGGSIGLISPLSHSFCEKCSRIRLTSDGKLRLCLHSNLEVDLKDLSGDELIEAIKKAILLKPKEHHLIKDKKSSSERGMSEIGG